VKKSKIFIGAQYQAYFFSYKDYKSAIFGF